MIRNVFALISVLLAAVNMASCAQTGNRKEQDNMGNKKILVAFFSRAGENYAVGNIEKGNTHILAEIIAAGTGGTLFRIEPVAPYPEDYEECTLAAKAEMTAKARPAIKGDAPVEDFDVIFVGYPNWWGDMPMPVYTFIERHSWQGKTVVPFCTHEGSGLSATESRLVRACEGAEVLEGLAVRGYTVQNSQAETRRYVADWLEKSGF